MTSKRKPFLLLNTPSKPLSCLSLSHVSPSLSLSTPLPFTGEILFLLSGVYITYCIRNARREIYKEKWTLCSIVYLELVISTITYALRHLLYQNLHPDYLFSLYFLRCQLTVTLALILLLFPKVSMTVEEALHWSLISSMPTVYLVAFLHSSESGESTFLSASSPSPPPQPPSLPAPRLPTCRCIYHYSLTLSLSLHWSIRSIGLHSRNRRTK